MRPNTERIAGAFGCSTPFSFLPNSMINFLCSSVIVFGMCTSNEMISSPTRLLFIPFTPLPHTRIFLLHCGPAGTFTFTAPLSVGTVTVPPRIAVVTEIGMLQYTSLPWRSKNGSGCT